MIDVAPAEGLVFSGEVRLDDTHVYWAGAGADTCTQKPCLCGAQPCTGKIWRATKPDGPPKVFAEGDWRGVRGLAVTTLQRSSSQPDSAATCSV